MAPGRTRDEQKERQWRRWIEQWQTSGLSVSDFYAWRRTLHQRAADTPAFVAVQVVADTTPAPATALEVVLGDGRIVRVAPGFDAATLRRLLALLQEGGAC